MVRSARLQSRDRGGTEVPPYGPPGHGGTEVPPYGLPGHGGTEVPPYGLRRWRGTKVPRYVFLLPVLALLSLAQVPIPTRIVSTSPSITETLFALGLGDRVVGVSRYCWFPAD